MNILLIGGSFVIRLPARRGPLPLRQEGLSQRGRGALRRGTEDGSAPRPTSARLQRTGRINPNSIILREVEL